MDPARWKLIQEIFHHAVSLTLEDRDQYLPQACRGDAELLSSIRCLLERDAAQTSAWEQNLDSVLDEQTGSLLQDLGPYRFLRMLGQGGMGTVYQARHLSTGQFVAIKVLRTGQMSEPSRERFATEQRALARLNHPLIARLYGSETFPDGTPCFIMEYVEGKRLTTYCQDNKCSIRERVILFRQVCVAVQHAHGQGIIHRDLKPSNILVKPDRTVRLLDFGIAKELDATGQNLTGSQPAPMTINYAAPEQILGEPVGVHTDVHGLGVTLYELLTGRPPHDVTGLTPGAAETVILEGKIDRPSRALQAQDKPASRELRGADVHDLDILCSTALQRDPKRRYQTAEALIRDLDHWLAHQTLDARPDNFGYRATKFATRNWKPLLTSFAIAASGAAASIWFTLNLARARDAALREQVRTQQIEQFVFSLFNNGNSDAGVGKNLTALSILDRGRKEVLTLQRNPDLQADLFGVLGGLYVGLGRTKEADQLLLLALKFHKAHDPKSVAMARTLIDIGKLRAQESLYPEAEALIQQGLELLIHNPAASAHDVAAAETELGEAFCGAEQGKRATPLLESALKLERQSSPPDPQLGKTLRVLANAQQSQGRYREAEAFGRQALAVDQRQFADSNPELAFDLLNLATVQTQEGRLPEAESNYRKALSRFRDWYAGDSPDILDLEIALSETLIDEGKNEEGRRTLLSGIEMNKRLYGKETRDSALGWMNLGTLDQKAGHLDAARADFQHALDGAREIFGASSMPVGVTISNLATVELQAKKYRVADQLYRQSMEILAKIVPADGVEMGKLNLNLGKVMFYEHHYSEAAERLKRAISIFERQPKIFQRELTTARATLDQVSRAAVQ